MLTMTKSHNDFVSVFLFLVLNLQTCCGNYTCYQLSSGKDICFMFDGIKRTFEESKQFCLNNGGFLLEIHNNKIQRLVQQFGNDTKLSFVEVWLNLVRTNSNVWIWGDERSGNYLNYSHWEVGNPALNDAKGINNAFMIANYKWKNTYEPQQASTICMQESGVGIAYPIGTPISTVLYLITKTPVITTTTISIQESKISPSYLTGTPATSKNKENSSSSTTSNPISTSTTTSTISLSLPPPTTITTTTNMQPTYAIAANSDSSSSSSLAAAVVTKGIGVGVGLGGLVLIIVSSLLIAKFVFHKEIPLPFKSSRSRKSSPHETGGDIIKGSYDQMNEKKLHRRSPYAEVVMSNPPPNSNLTYICFQDLIQPISDSRIEGLSKADYETPQTFGKNIYDKAV